MLLAGTRIDEVTEDTLRSLIGASESRCLDFKRDQYGAGDSGKKEFAADISSFANTVGGHLILGMAEQDGMAGDLVGVEFAPNADAERVRLEQAARSGIQPRITGLSVVTVPLSNGRQAMIIEIPPSFTKPHRVIVGGSCRFHARAGGGKYQPDVFELKELFDQGPATADKVRDFRLERTAQIMAGQTPVGLADYRSAYVLHIVPLTSFSGAMYLDMNRLRQSANNFYPLIATSRNEPTTTPTVEGLVVYDWTNRECYTSVRRDGRVEAVLAPVVNPMVDRVPPWVSGDGLRNWSVNGLNSYLAGLKALDIAGPYAVMISLLGIGGAWLDNCRLDCRFQKEAVYAREVIIDEDLDFGDAAIKERLLAYVVPSLHEIANAAGTWSWPKLD